MTDDAAQGEFPALSQPTAPAAGQVWTRLRCSRCAYVAEHPGPPTDRDVDTCGLCGAGVRSVTVFRVSGGGSVPQGRADLRAGRA
jgi:hypothetical protein